MNVFKEESSDDAIFPIWSVEKPFDVKAALADK